jgi:hypothetical protein
MVSALPRLAFAAWAVVSMAACAPSAIDVNRSSFETPSVIATQAAARAELSLAHHQARYELNLQADTPPASSYGAYLEAYQRWTKGKVHELPESSSQED